MLVVKLTSEIESRLSQLAMNTGRSKHSVAERAIIEQLDDLEDRYLSDHRARQVANGESSTMSIEELIAKYRVSV